MKEKISNYGKYFFIAALMLETLFVLLDKSNYIIQHETWLFRFTFLLFGVKILMTSYSRKEWVAIIGMAIVGVISWFSTGREEIIRVSVLLIACKGVNMKQAMKVVLYETLVGSMIIILLSITGIYGAMTVTGHFRGGGIEETRYCLGMGHPNALHCMFLMTMTLALALYDDRIDWKWYVAALILNYGVYVLTDSRTSFLIGTATVIFAAFMHYATHLRDKKVLYYLAIAFIIGCVLLSVYIAIVGVDIPFLRQIDIRINGRFQWARSEGGIGYWSLFSNEMNQNYFDMGYVRLFYWYGIVPAIMYIIMMCTAVWRCWKYRAYDAFLVIMVFAAYSLIEAHAVSVYIGRNYALFYMGTLIFSDQVQTKSE